MTEMSIDEIQARIVSEFALFDDWMQKYEYLISLGKKLPLIDEANKTDANLIDGCQSRVWLHAEVVEGRIRFTGDSDAIITKGIIALLIRVLSDQKPADILQTELNFIDDIGLTQHLSPTRSNGLFSMLKQMKYYALAFQETRQETH